MINGGDPEEMALNVFILLDISYAFVVELKGSSTNVSENSSGTLSLHSRITSLLNI